MSPADHKRGSWIMAALLGGLFWCAVVGAVVCMMGCGGTVWGAFEPVTTYTATGEPVVTFVPSDQVGEITSALAGKAGGWIGRYFGGEVGAQVGGAAAIGLAGLLTGRGRAGKLREQLARAEEEAKRKRADADYAEGLLAATGTPQGKALIDARAPRT